MKKFASIMCVLAGIFMVIAAIMNFQDGSILMEIGYIVFALFFFLYGFAGVFGKKQ